MAEAVSDEYGDRYMRDTPVVSTSTAVTFVLPSTASEEGVAAVIEEPAAGAFSAM